MSRRPYARGHIEYNRFSFQHGYVLYSLPRARYGRCSCVFLARIVRTDWISRSLAGLVLEIGQTANNALFPRVAFLRGGTGDRDKWDGWNGMGKGVWWIL